MSRRLFRVAVFVALAVAAVRALTRAAAPPPGAGPRPTSTTPDGPPRSARDAPRPDPGAMDRVPSPAPAESPSVTVPEAPAERAAGTAAQDGTDEATSTDAEVLAAIAAAGAGGITVKDLVEQTGIAESTLRSAALRLEGSPETNRSSPNYGEPRNPEDVRAERVPDKRPIHYRALDAQASGTSATEPEPAPDQG